MLEVARLEQQRRSEFFQHVREYVEEFTYLNPLRSLDLPTQAAAPLLVTDKVKKMAQKIVNSTTLPPVGYDEATGLPEIGTDPGGGPDIVVAAILEKPPTVSILHPDMEGQIRRMQINPPLGKNKRMEIIPAPKEDIDLAKTKTIFFEHKFPSSENFNFFIEKCKNFLRSPEVIVDGFGSSVEGHKRRRNYEIAIKTALNYLGPEWSDQFHKRWDNHRITKNTQGGVIMAFDNLSKSLADTQSLEMPIKIKPDIDGFNEQMKEVKALRESEKYAESSKLLASICRRAIEIFKFEGTDIQVAEQLRAPPRYQKEFIVNLYKKLFRDQTIWSYDPVSLLWSIDSKIKDKEYERLFPFLKAMIEYDEIDFEGIFHRIDNLDEKELKPRTDNPNLEAMQYAVMRVFLEAKSAPAERMGDIFGSSGSRRDDLPTKEQVEKARRFDVNLYKPAYANEETLKKTMLVINQITAEIINGVSDGGSLLSKIFFRHTVSRDERRTPLTLAYLQSMQI